jgi:hypothetical protein
MFLQWLSLFFAKQEVFWHSRKTTPRRSPRIIRGTAMAAMVTFTTQELRTCTLENTKTIAS